MPENLTILEEHACFDGTVGFYAHESEACDGEMRFAVYVSTPGRPIAR